MAEARQCLLCGGSFQPKKKAQHQKYCCVECRERQRSIQKEQNKTRIERHCPVCGKTFVVESEKNLQKYCSGACRGKRYYIETTKKRRAQAALAERQCLYCGAIFQVGYRGHRKQYCNTKCREANYKARIKKERQFSQEQIDGRHCLYCGTPITQPPGRKPKMYCSPSCGTRFRYYTPPEERSALRKHQVKTLRPRIVCTCRCCGEEFTDEDNKPRVYCSDECRNASHSYAKNERQVAVDEIVLQPGMAARRTVWKMSAEGMSASEIVNATGYNKWAVRSWLRAQEKPPKRILSEPHYRYIHARHTAEWLAVLEDEMAPAVRLVASRCPVRATGNPTDRSVVLICGTSFLRRDLFAFVAIVQSLRMDPMDGRTYAFCNSQRDQLLYFWWDGSGFQMTRRRRNYGRYVWPPEKLEATIAVTPAEFAFILYESQQKEQLETC